MTSSKTLTWKDKQVDILLTECEVVNSSKYVKQEGAGQATINEAWLQVIFLKSGTEDKIVIDFKGQNPNFIPGTHGYLISGNQKGIGFYFSKTNNIFYFVKNIADRLNLQFSFGFFTGSVFYVLTVGIMMGIVELFGIDDSYAPYGLATFFFIFIAIIINVNKQSGKASDSLKKEIQDWVSSIIK